MVFLVSRYYNKEMLGEKVYAFIPSLELDFTEQYFVKFFLGFLSWKWVEQKTYPSNI